MNGTCGISRAGLADGSAGEARQPARRISDGPGGIRPLRTQGRRYRQDPTRLDRHPARRGDRGRTVHIVPLARGDCQEFPELAKVRGFCRALEIPVTAAFTALGVREGAADVGPDVAGAGPADVEAQARADMQRDPRRLIDPTVPRRGRPMIRDMLRYLAGGVRAPRRADPGPTGRRGNKGAPAAGGRPLARAWLMNQMTRTDSACGPFGPRATSNSTRWFSSSER